MSILWQTIQDKIPNVKFYVAVSAGTVGAVAAVYAISRWMVRLRIKKKIKTKRAKCKASFEKLENGLKTFEVSLAVVIHCINKQFLNPL